MTTEFSAETAALWLELEDVDTWAPVEYDITVLVVMEAAFRNVERENKMVEMCASMANFWAIRADEHRKKLHEWADVAEIAGLKIAKES